MVLYRFLFAPVLLAVAVLMGARDKAGAPQTGAPAVEARASSPASGGPSLGPARARTARTHPDAVH